MGNILVTSGYGGNTHQPFVMIEADVLDRPLQLSPDEARSLARGLLESAFAAESDGFLVEFTKDELHQDLNVAVGILNNFRKWREKKKKWGKRETPRSPFPGCLIFRGNPFKNSEKQGFRGRKPGWVLDVSARYCLSPTASDDVVNKKALS